MADLGHTTAHAEHPKHLSVEAKFIVTSPLTNPEKIEHPFLKMH